MTNGTYTISKRDPPLLPPKQSKTEIIIPHVELKQTCAVDCTPSSPTDRSACPREMQSEGAGRDNNFHTHIYWESERHTCWTLYLHSAGRVARGAMY